MKAKAGLAVSAAALSNEEPAEAFQSLRQALQGELSELARARAARLCAKITAATADERLDASILLAGQVTTSWLAPLISLRLAEAGLCVRVSEAPYDSTMPALSSWETGKRLDAVILIPWLHAHSKGHGSEAIAPSLSPVMWRSAWQLATKLQATVIQVGFDWPYFSPDGLYLDVQDGGSLDAVRMANQGLRKTLPDAAIWFDVDALSSWTGKQQFYSQRNYFWTKQPYSDAGLTELAHGLARTVQIIQRGTHKVLILDLDNTLWGGVVAEEGPLGVTIGGGPDGEAFEAFQRYVKALTDRGILLAICSKNDDPIAREPFERNPEMVLTLADFAAFQASWQPKSESIRQIAAELRLGADSFVFFDDNPAEREEVRLALPDVLVVDVPPDPADYTLALAETGAFDSLRRTDEDLLRTQQYRVESERREAEQGFTDMGAYLQHLQMKATVVPIDETRLPRVSQLVGKTNQFNLTTRRHSSEQLQAMIAIPGTIAFAVSLSDRFGDYGLIAVLIGVRESPDVLRIDTWLMSCRVIGRTVEAFVLNTLVDRARGQGYQGLLGEYIQTKKNNLVADLYDRLGFEDQDTCRWYLALDEALSAETHVVG